jgi:hypothetical protein
MEQENFLWLQKWYQAHCDGDWEHSNGILLATIDNPGWSLTIDLQDTELENKKFQEISLERSDSEWVFCAIKDGKFEGRCGTGNLPEVLNYFRIWAESTKQNINKLT